MDQFQKQIQRQLLANIMKDKCSHSEYLVFRDAWCTQERVIRFTTSYFRELLGVLPNDGGRWKTGDFVMYEVQNEIDNLIVECVFALSFVPSDKRNLADNLMNSCFAEQADTANNIVLRKWNLTTSDYEPNQLMEEFDRLINKDIPLFEKELQESMYPLNEEPETFVEGSAISALLNKYERNRQAREVCLAHYGTACAVCGMDFAKTYGPEFAGNIEVHHIVPIGEIGKSYIVDPIRDLIPVCPNCHSALHSKKDGVYSVEELKAIWMKK